MGDSYPLVAVDVHGNISGRAVERGQWLADIYETQVAGASGTVSAADHSLDEACIEQWLALASTQIVTYRVPNHDALASIERRDGLIVCDGNGGLRARGRRRGAGWSHPPHF